MAQWNVRSKALAQEHGQPGSPIPPIEPLRDASLILLTFVALALLALFPGCAPVRASSASMRVLEHNADAIEGLAGAYARDLAWLRAHLDASLEQRRALLLGTIHRSLIGDGLIGVSDPEPHAIDEAIEAGVQRTARADTSAPPNPLIAEVASGRMTRIEARRFVHDYTIATRLNGDAARKVRHEMLSTLAPISDHDRQAQAIRAAFAEHETRVALLFNELTSNADSLRGAIKAHEEGASARATTWIPLLEHIEDPDLRSGARSLLMRMLEE
ncbi:MAG: hypothetical protein ACTS3F_03105 [Phycisphaerales bacterium]